MAEYEALKQRSEAWIKAKPWVAMAAGIVIGFLLHGILF